MNKQRNLWLNSHLMYLLQSYLYDPFDFETTCSFQQTTQPPNPN